MDAQFRAADEGFVVGDIAHPVRILNMRELCEVASGSVRTALGGAAVVGGEDDDRVVELAEFVQGVDDASDALIDRVDHRRVHLHVAGEPGLHFRRE